MGYDIHGRVGRRTRRVLVVEDRAHRPMGHFPTRFAELAEGFAEAGCAVEVLTSQRLVARRRARRSLSSSTGTDRSTGSSTGSASRSQNTRGLRRIASRLRTMGIGPRGARSRCRDAGDPMPDVVVVSTGIDPLVASAFAKRGRWLFYEFGGPSRPFEVRERAARASHSGAPGGRRGSRHRTMDDTATMGARSPRSSTRSPFRSRESGRPIACRTPSVVWA